MFSMFVFFIFFYPCSLNMTTAFATLDQLYGGLSSSSSSSSSSFSSSYLSSHGHSLAGFLLTIVVGLGLVAYFTLMATLHTVQQDWTHQRCHPYVLPFAHWVHPKVTNEENLQFCLNQTLSATTGDALGPLAQTVQQLQQGVTSMATDIESSRSMFDKMRTFFADITHELYGRTINVTTELDVMARTNQDIVGKMNGVLVTTLYTLLGSYDVLRSLMGAMVQIMVTIMIGFAAAIALLWLNPVTWGLAASSTAMYTAVAIPLGISLSFLVNKLHIHTGMKVPTLHTSPAKCFDADTWITPTKRICDLHLGDCLEEDNVHTRVNALFRLSSDHVDMCVISGGDTPILVSGTHKMVYEGQWVNASTHPHTFPYPYPYRKPVLYCLSVVQKQIRLGTHVFSDWDEVSLEMMDHLERTHGITSFDQLVGGFHPDTLITLHGGGSRKIQDVALGDHLHGGGTVYGTVVIDGRGVPHYQYVIQGKPPTHSSFCGGPNVVYYVSRTKTNSTALRHGTTPSVPSVPYLYHLLTEQHRFWIHSLCCVADYNGCLDHFLLTPRP